MKLSLAIWLLLASLAYSQAPDVRQTAARVGAISQDKNIKRATSATAIHVDKSGTWLLTCAHGSSEGDTIGVTFTDGSQVLAERIAFSEQLDLAVLKVNIQWPHVARLAETYAGKGDVVWTSAFDESGTYAVISGKVTGYANMWHNGSDSDRYVGWMNDGKPVQLTKSETSCRLLRALFGRRRRCNTVTTQVEVTSNDEAIPVPENPEVSKMKFNSGLTQMMSTTRATQGNSGGGQFNESGELVAVLWGDPQKTYGTNVATIQHWLVKVELTDLSWDMDPKRLVQAQDDNDSPFVSVQVMEEIESLLPEIEEGTEVSAEEILAMNGRPRPVSEIRIDRNSVVEDSVARVKAYMAENADYFRGLRGEDGVPGTPGEPGEDGPPGEPGPDVDVDMIIQTVSQKIEVGMDSLFERLKADIKDDPDFKGADGVDGTDGHSPVMSIDNDGNLYSDNTVLINLRSPLSTDDKDEIVKRVLAALPSYPVAYDIVPRKQY